MSPPPVTRNPAKTLPQQQAQQKAAQQQNDTTPQKKVAKEPFHFDEDVGLGCIQGWFGQQGVQSMKSISETPQKGSDWIAEKKYEHIENRHQSDLKRHVQDLKEALGDIDGGNVLVGLRDLFKSDLDTLGGGAICDPPQKASAWTCQTWEEARRLPFDDGNLDNDGDTEQIVEDDTDNIQQQPDVKATGLGTIFGGVEGATEAHAICDPPQAVTAWHAEKDSMRLPFNGEGDLKLEGHHDLKCDDAAGGNTNTQQRGIGKQMNVVTPSDLGKVFGGVDGATEAHAICDPPQQAGAWHAEKDSMRLPFNGEGNQKIEGQEEGGDIEAGANDDDTNLKPNINTQSQQQQRFVQPVTPCDLGVVFGGVEGFTENHAICDPPQKASAWVAEEDSMRPPFQTQAKHEQNVFMRRQQHAHQG